jgi:acetyltransferase
VTTRNLEALFAPRSIALIGASAEAGSVGDVVAANLLAGGFAGPVRLVNPHAETVRGVRAHGSIATLPESPDLAVITTPAAAVPGVIAELGAHGCRAAVVISAGFEGPGAPAALRQQALDAARPHLLRVVGPNCLGVLSPLSGVNASFARAMPPRGRLALVAQSGAVATALMDWGSGAGIGFSRVITLGDCADVDVGDVLDLLAIDAETHGVLLYLEAAGDGRKFMSAARALARVKPVAAIKAGRSAAGAQAAMSHTGALAGTAAVYDAVLRRAGVLEVDSLDDLCRAARLFDAGLHGAGPRLAVLTNGGGAGVMAVDALAAEGGHVADLAPATLAALDALAPRAWSRGDPVDVLGDAGPKLVGDAARVLLDAEEVDALLVIHCPTAVADVEAITAQVVAARQAHPRKPLLAAFVGGPAVAVARERFIAAKIPAFESPEAAVQAFVQLDRLRRSRALLTHAPATGAAQVHAARARRIVEDALINGRAMLTDPEARAVLAAYGAPVAASVEASTPDAAAEAARALGAPVALKILSRDITHKSDVGGVRLNLASPEAARAAARSMAEAVAAARPDARIDGFIVEPMIDRSAATELLAGVVQDPTFGPMVLVGQGGVTAEVAADRAMALPPLNRDLALDMVGRTRVARLLAGYRDRAPADLDALAACLETLGRLATDLPEIVELDINPLLCDARGVLALDARIALKPATERTPRPAILPYPADLGAEVVLGGERLRLRPIRPDDADRLQAMVDRCDRQDVRLRFRSAMKHMSDDLIVLLTQIDYDRQMALVVETGGGEILGVGRLAADPDGERGEFALIVRTDRQRRGLGRVLLGAVVDHARRRGLSEVWGDVAYDNARMLGLARAMGFDARPAAETGRLRVSLELSHALAVMHTPRRETPA